MRVGQRLLEYSFQRVVTAGGLVVGAVEHFGANSLRHGHARLEAAVPPAFLGGIFFCRIRAIGNQHVDPAHAGTNRFGFLVDEGLILGKAFIFRRVNIPGRLMIAGEENRFTTAVDAVAEIDHRMIEQIGRNRCRANLHLLLGRQGDILDLGLHLGFAHREIAVLQLDGHHLINAAPADRIKRAVQPQAVAGDEIGNEKWQPLNVIPVRVGNKDIGCHRQLGKQRLRKRENARTGIENNQLVEIGTHLDTGRVAAVTHCIRPWRGD